MSEVKYFRWTPDGMVEWMAHPDLCAVGVFVRHETFQRHVADELPACKVLAHDLYRRECETSRQLRDEVARLKERKDGAYLERNQVVATLAKCFPSGIARTAIDGWDEEWHGCVYIDLPTGQVSWHYHDSHAHLFAGLPPYNRAWDGHSTEEKYQRLAALTPQAGKAGVNG